MASVFAAAPAIVNIWAPLLSAKQAAGFTALAATLAMITGILTGQTSIRAAARVKEHVDGIVRGLTVNESVRRLTDGP